MTEAHGRRATLEWRIRTGNTAANAFSVGIVFTVLASFAGENSDLWLIAAVFFVAATVSTVRFVTAMRTELFQMGLPRPNLVVDNTPPDDEEWN